MAKVGLVLSGGGAKGAYHVGVIQALQALNIKIDMLAGASIGALNSAVLLSATNEQEGLKHLNQLWDKLPQIKPIQMEKINKNISFDTSINASTYISLLLSAGLRLNPVGLVATLVHEGYKRFNLKSLEGFCKEEPLTEMMNEFLNLENLQKALPFFISTYHLEDKDSALENFITSVGAIKDFAKAEVLGLDNKQSSFYKIQDLNTEDQKKYILASAALPLIFIPQKNNQGQRCVDGGLGGALKAQGNTPITPLIEAGCTHVIVVHLDHGSLWHRHDFPNTNIIEIRPSQTLDLSFSKLLDFSKENIDTLRKQGYIDAMQELKHLESLLASVTNMQKNNQTMHANLNALENSEQSLDEIMKKLNF